VFELEFLYLTEFEKAIARASEMEYAFAKEMVLQWE